MLYVFHGSDIKRGVEKAHSLINSLRAKKPDAALESISADNWNFSVLEGHFGGQGLFSNRYIVFLDRITENSEAKEKIIDFIPTMAESANIFIVLEGRLNTELKKAFGKSSEKMVECNLPVASIKQLFGSTSSKEDFNIFALADALGMRDSFKAWSIYRQAIDFGLEVESIVGTIFWQIKSMIVAHTVKSVAESGLNPFVFMKAKKASENYLVDELESNASQIISLYHDGHRGRVDLELGIERFILAIDNFSEVRPR
ncbi:MAG: hypothetical protein AAB470_02090 [Patescibacteria group bacterium]